MAFLGHSVQLLFQQPSVSDFSEAWEQLGFEPLPSTANSESDNTLLSDGQLIVSCHHGDTKPPALRYFHADVDGLHQKLQDKGLALEFIPNDKITFEMPGGLEVVVCQQPFEELLVVTKVQNSLLGYADALVVNVPDLSAAQHWAENVGYFVQEQQHGAVSSLDVFDGLFTISFRKSTGKKLFVSYVTVFDNDLVEDLKSVAPAEASTRTYADGSIMYVEIPMSQELSLIVSPDDE